LVYIVYGQRISCTWPLDLPGLPALGFSPDVTIEVAEAECFLSARKLAGVGDRQEWRHHAVLGDGTTYLQWTDLFEFLVSPDGGRILGHPLKHATDESFKTYLLGQVLSFALLHRGIEQLHATTVAVDGQAVAFLGNSGYGKSSLGGAFLRAGYSILTDDLLVLEANGRGFQAHPGPPRIKMFPEMAREFLPGQAAGDAMNHTTRKMIIPLRPEQTARQKTPLRAIYVLNTPAASARSRRVSIRGMSHRKAFLELLTNTFNTVNSEPERLKSQFVFAHAVCNAVPVRALSYPRDFRIVPQIITAVLADLQGMA
jgi:hypothetical protein